MRISEEQVLLIVAGEDKGQRLGTQEGKVTGSSWRLTEQLVQVLSSNKAVTPT